MQSFATGFVPCAQICFVLLLDLLLFDCPASGDFFMSATFEETQKELYKSFQPVFCPALQEDIHFNADGFHHLVYVQKKRRPRGKSERYYRLALLPYVHSVIANSLNAKPQIISTSPPVTAWGLSYKLIKSNTNGKLCTVKVVVIRKKPGGRLYFLSVMCQRKCKDRKRFLGFPVPSFPTK
jgi:hypothetical protein